jgi:hypothetical protein
MLSDIIAGMGSCMNWALRLIWDKHDRSGQLAIEYYDLSLKLVDDDLSSRESTDA